MAMYNLGSTAFIVEAHRNGKWEKVFESKVIKFGDQSQKVSADISGSDKIRLTSTDGGDGIECDHAVWANALLK
jgi:alpha-galactosidase